MDHPKRKLMRRLREMSRRMSATSEMMRKTDPSPEYQQHADELDGAAAMLIDWLLEIAQTLPPPEPMRYGFGQTQTKPNP